MGSSLKLTTARASALSQITQEASRIDGIVTRLTSVGGDKCQGEDKKDVGEDKYGGEVAVEPGEDASLFPDERETYMKDINRFEYSGK